MPPDPCPSQRELLAFQSGEADPNAIDRIAAHAAECSTCEAALRALDGDSNTFSQSLRRLQGQTSQLAPPPEGPGSIVAGRYRLIELLGEGGMGTVYMAQQAAPVRRLVAIKLIKPGMDSKAVLARFEAERQALALMDHPNIAKVLDAGTTEAGRPFFVMELVKGVPITQFCDERRWTPQQRLELFVPVCQAVQHAHQKGVIHRDLKPSNVLVALYDDRPVPKVIDFGVAKAAGQPLTEQTFVTGFGAVVGTPEYMSPEQATFNALDVDTRTDVFSLGVLLYELLTGSPPLGPIELRKAGLLEMLQLVREKEPTRPSTQLSSAETLPAIAAARGTEPRKLAKLVRGELDWIVMRALEKDRTRRYETANGLALDLQRHLNGEPVQAVPPSASYRMQKFVRRYRGPVVAVGLLLLALVGGVIGTTVGLFRARQAQLESESLLSETRDTKVELARQLEGAEKARKKAEIEREAAVALADFVQRDIIDQANVREQAIWRDVVNPDLTVREALDRAAARVNRRTGWNKRTEAAVRTSIGNAFVAVGQPDKGVAQLERALRLKIEDPDYGEKHPDTVFAMHQLVAAYLAAGQVGMALPLAERALEFALARYAQQSEDTQGPLVTMNDVALCYRQSGQLDEAVRRLEKVREWAEAKYAEDNLDVEMVRLNLAEAYFADGRFEEARSLLEQLLSRDSKSLDHRFAATTRSILANVLLEQGELEYAERLLRECLKMRRFQEPKNWVTYLSASDLGGVLLRQGKADEAEPLLLEGYREMKAREGAMPTRSRYLLGEAAGRLADLAAARGNAADVAKWQAEKNQYPPRPKKKNPSQP